jgi:hypothetical protein
MINFSLLTSIGKCDYDVSVLPENILSALDFYKNLG